MGEEVATALTDSLTSMLAFLATNFFATGKQPVRTGNDHAIASPYGLFEASDGQVAIAPANDAVYLKFLDALDLTHLKDHPEFLSNADRFERRAAINFEINARTRTQPVAHWIARLNAAGVPCGRVLSLAEVFDDPQTRHQQMRITIEHPAAWAARRARLSDQVQRRPLPRASAAAGAGRGYRCDPGRVRARRAGHRRAARRQCDLTATPFSLGEKGWG